MFRSTFQKFTLVVFLMMFLAVPKPALGHPDTGASTPPERVVLAAPGAFAKSSPSNLATGQPRDITFTWGSSSGAASYQYCYDTAATGACTGAWISAGTSTNASLSMPAGTTFYWQVRAVSSGEYTYANGSADAKWRFDLLPDPGAFNKTAPADQATGQPVDGLVLSWSASDNAAGYQYCLNTSGPSCPGSWTATNSPTPSITLNDLTAGATYYWQVQAVNMNNTVVTSNGWWRFTIAPAPGAFSKSTPAVDATGQSTSPTLTWAASTNATSYEYCTSASAACTSNLWLSTGTTRTAAITGLTPGATTYWQVRAVNPSGSVEANGGTWWKFTAAPLPGAFNKTTPTSGAVDQPINSMVLNWGTSANATKYEYCYDTAASGACSGTWINAGTNKTATISAVLLPDTLYRWQVRASTINGVVYANGLDTATWTFRTLPPPAAFNKTAPADLATGQTNGQLVLSWGASSAGAAYEYCFNTTESCTDTSWVTTGSVTTATIGGLTPGGTYYWQVRARNGSGMVYANDDSNPATLTNDWWTFTTRLTPDDFSKTAPANGAADQIISGLQLSWGTSGNVTSYEYCVNTSAACPTAADWKTTSTSRTATLTSLPPGTTYYWQVRARNTSGTTDANAATWWSFTTLPKPGAFTKNATETYYNLENRWVIEWGASTKAASYEYCVSTTNSTCPGGVWTTNGTALSASLPGLTFGTTYYWQVRARNTSGTTDADGGTWGSFTTTSLPGTFSKTAPANGVTGQEINNLQLSWGASTGATGYEYCISTSASCANGVWTSATSPATLNGLLPGITYYWQVRARNINSGATEANDGTWWSFSTKAYPGPFNKVAPANNATAQPINNLALSWSASGNATSYQYCVNTTPSCPDTSWINTNTALTATTGSLTPGTIYYWQVRANNSFGSTYANEVWWSFTTKPLPGAFAKITLANGLTGQSINGLIFSWGASTNTDSYEYCLSTTSAACPNNVWTSTSTNRTVTLGNLQAGATYYWQVRAKNISGTTDASGGWFTFTTLAAPGTFSKTSPTNNAVGQPTTGLVLTWAASSSAASYEYCFSQTATCPGDTWTSTGTTLTATVPTSLTAGTKYYWQVRARNINGLTMANSAWWSLTTLQGPGAFNKTSPATGAANQPINGLALNWGASSNASGYEYCYNTSASCLNNQWSSANTAQTVTLPTLAPNTTYYWQVRAWNVYGTTEASGGWWSFTTQSQLGAFTKIAPTNGATGQAVNGLVLSWNASSGATSYEYCYNTSASCPGSWTQNSTNTTATLNSLTPGVTYHWQVRAINSTGTVESTGGWWTFSTSQQLPGSFSKSLPANLASDQPVNGLAISWGTSANATSYEYCYNTTASCAGSWTTTGTSTTATLNGLGTGTAYYWQVRARNSNGTTDASGGWWTFTTQATSAAFSKNAPANSVTNQPTNGLVLSWGASANATRYDVCVSFIPTCPAEDNWSNTGLNRTATLNGLLANTKYYWQVRAIYNSTTTYANGSAGASWNFTTEAQSTSKVYLPIIQAPPPYYTIAGKITLDGIGLSGVTVTTNDGKTAVTDPNGNYTLSLVQGTYTLTPAKTGYTFSPATRTVTTPPAATGQNFTAAQDCSEVVKNSSFETRDYWEIPATEYTAGYTSSIARAGSWALRAGIVDGYNTYSWSSAWQAVTLPSTLNNATLKFWLYPFSGEAFNATPVYPELVIGKKPEEAFMAGPALNTATYSDVQQAIILDQYGNVLQSLVRQTSNAQQWEEWTFDLSAYAGQTIRIYFDVYNDGYQGLTGMYVDDVSLKICK